MTRQPRVAQGEGSAMAMFTRTSGYTPQPGPPDRARGDVFPVLHLYPAAGMLIGLLATLVTLGVLVGRGWEMAATAGLVSGLGAIVGLFVGMGRAVRRPVPSEPDPLDPAPPLWDAWLDEGRDPAAAPEPVSTEDESRPAQPADSHAIRPVVRPRVISPETGEAIRLEDEIGPILLKKRGGLVVIVGGPGSGKTTALEYLDGILPPWWSRHRVRLLETFDRPAIVSAGPDPLLIVALDDRGATNLDQLKIKVASADESQPLERLVALTPDRQISFFRLARWSLDDAIEYLLAADRASCGSVIGRLKGAGDFDFLDGIPELCVAVLDRMRRDRSIDGARSALRAELDLLVGDSASNRRRVEEFSLDVMLRGVDPVESPSIDLRLGLGAFADQIVRLIRHRPVALMLAADRIAAIVSGGSLNRALSGTHPHELIREVAQRITGNDVAIEHLSWWIRGHKRGVHPLAASLLHAASASWRPKPGYRPNLQDAHLGGAQWPEVNLDRCNLVGVELGSANLARASLINANVNRANLRGANLAGADLSSLVALHADLAHADLSGANAPQAILRMADLSNAILVNANLWQATLTDARIEGADFRDAVLEDAVLQELPLRLARLDGARFGGAILTACDLEGVELPNADFHDACLWEAILTGSRMPGANFLGASLWNARMAEIDWPGACLRDANLRGASFHPGTTRSGMLDSPIACEGSRTGFYTDDPLDPLIQPARLIRKANRRGADLRGAQVEGADFYLVDLRDALYTQDQAEHFRRCGAILEAPSE